jgi:hypothetical protein
MEKTEMMKRYEAETGRKSVRGITDGIHAVWFDIWHYQYLQWLEAKADAYDRIMSGGKKTLKEWANLFGMVVAVDMDGEAWAFSGVPVIDREIWRNNEAHYGQGAFEIPKKLVEFDGNWKDSLTLPDGWEEK